MGKTREGHGEKNVFSLLLYITGRHLVRDVLKPINTFGKSENEKVGGNVILNDIFQTIENPKPDRMKTGACPDGVGLSHVDANVCLLNLNGAWDLPKAKRKWKSLC